ncbi:TadE/TadG family type IV pilus assembly protein [Planctomycetota bacterium]
MGRLALVSMGKRDGRRGLELVEFALIVPLLMLLTMGILEYGWLFIKQHETGRAARGGVRKAVLPFTTNDEVLAVIDATMSASRMAESGYTVTLTPSDVSLPYPSDIVTVEVSVPYENITLMGLPFIPVPTNLRSSASMAKEGP